MKQLLVVKPHSFVDVITNSSTELFVNDSDKSFEQIEAILRDMLNTYNKTTDSNKTFDETFDVEVFTKEEYNKLRINIEEDLDYDYSYGYEKKENIGKIFIYSNGDNEIPYSLFDLIEEAFNAERFHLG